MQRYYYFPDYQIQNLLFIKGLEADKRVASILGRITEITIFYSVDATRLLHFVSISIALR